MSLNNAQPLPTATSGPEGSQPPRPHSAKLQEYRARLEREARRERRIVAAYRIIIFVTFLGFWEVLTRIKWFAEHTFIDPFFISRPSLVIKQIYDWTLGSEAGFIWPHIWATLYATLLGLVISVFTGFLAGLLLSQKPRMAKVLTPFIDGLNSLPRIAFVPLITMIFGLGLASKVATAWFIVFFLVFYNTFRGCNSIDKYIIDFCRTLGGNTAQITWNVRIPHALAWTFAALPNAVAFSLIGVVIAEFIGSTVGMGYLIITSLSTLNSTIMFATITLLSIMGIILVTLIGRLERYLMRWAPEFH